MVVAPLGQLDMLFALRDVTACPDRGQQIDDEGENVTRENKSDG